VGRGEDREVPLVRTTIDRTFLLYPQWKFYGDYAVHETPKDASEKTIDWQRFIANASKLFGAGVTARRSWTRAAGFLACGKAE